MKPSMFLGGIALAFVSVAHADSAPQSHAASPEIYRVVAEDEKYRVIEATWKPGQKDVWHSHPIAYQYHVTDCSMRISTPDGKSRDASPKAGSSRIAPPIESHHAENIGASDCKIVFFEPKI